VRYRGLGNAKVTTTTTEPPASFFEELMEVFDRLAPAGSGGWLVADCVRRIDELAACFDAIGSPGSEPKAQALSASRSVASRLFAPVLERVRRAAREEALRAASGAVGMSLARIQFEALGAVRDALVFLETRVRELEDAERSRAGLAALLGRELPTTDQPEWAGDLAEAMGSVKGRVLVAECGAGALGSELVARGFEVLGAEPLAELAWEAACRGIAIRVTNPLEFLREQIGQAAGAVVLAGRVDWLSAEEKLKLVETAMRASPGGKVFVISLEPSFGGEESIAGVRALVPGRPVGGSGWAAVLSVAGMREVKVLGPRPAGRPLRATSLAYGTVDV